MSILSGVLFAAPTCVSWQSTSQTTLDVGFCPTSTESELADQFTVHLVQPTPHDCAITKLQATAGDKCQLTSLAAGTMYSADVSVCHTATGICSSPYRDEMTTMGNSE